MKKRNKLAWLAFSCLALNSVTSTSQILTPFEIYPPGYQVDANSNAYLSTQSSPCINGATPWVLGGNNLSFPNGGNTQIGTCDNYPFILKSFGRKSLYVTQSSFIGMGFNNAFPGAALDIKNSDPNSNPANESNFRIYADGDGNVESTTDINMTFASNKNLLFNEGSVGNSTNRMTIFTGGDVLIPKLAGAGNRWVLADNNGYLFTQNIGLSLNGQNLSINGGNTIGLPTQQLSISGNQISISNGNSISLPAASSQQISIAGNVVSLSGGGGNVTIPSQQLSIAGNVISLSGGGNVTIPSSADNLGNHTATTDLNMNSRFIKFGSGNTKLSDNSGALIVNATDLVTPRIKVGGDVLPSTDNFYNLGGSANNFRWKEIFCVNSTINTSDIRYKTNVKDLNYGIKELMKLRTITYNWKENDNGTRIGLVAQELQEVLPEVVMVGDNADKTLGVRYTELIPVLINAIKEQQTQITELKSMIGSTQNSAERKANNVKTVSISLSDKNSIVLNQNVPNPFAESTSISYNVPSDFNKAQIIFTAVDGTVIKVVDIKEKGAGNINVFADDLSHGIYTYSLVIDGKLIDTKKMVKE